LPKGERRLAAIMFTDMVGYTALTQDDEALALKLREKQQSLMRPIVSRYKGKEVKTMGDSSLIEFDSALDATHCAIEIQEHLHEYDRSAADEGKIRLRIGVHLGDVLRVKGDVLGDTVNLASRVEPLAEAGGVCVSEQVFAQVRNKISRPLLKLSTQELKNVRFPFGIYKIVMPWKDSSPGSMMEGVASRRRLAVLPLTNMSPDQSDEYLADGMTEEIISALSKIESVEVISRTSVMQYKKQAKQIREVARELDVGIVIEGSVRKAGDKLRVAIQMIDGDRDRHLWAETYDRKIEDVFAIQSDIARKVAESLQARMPGDGKHVETRSVEAYTLYLRAMQLSHDNSESSLREAVALFEKAVSKDPGFVRAYAGLAHAQCGLAAGYEDFALSVEKAAVAAQKSHELGPDSAEAYLALAYVHTFLDKFDLVVSEAEKAIEINPNLSEAYSTLGWINSSMGKLDAGVMDLERAYRLDPMSFRPGSEVSPVFQLAGKERQAQDFLERLRDLYPKNHRVYARWAEFYLVKRDFDGAQEMINTGLEISPSDIDLLTDQGVLYALTDRRKEAVKVLSMIETGPAEASRLQGELFIHAALGDMNDAFKSLTRLAEIHAWPPLVKSLPVFEAMRRDHRFHEFCLKVGLPG
jgi:adenylate cyclase